MISELFWPKEQTIMRTTSNFESLDVRLNSIYYTKVMVAA